MPLDYTLKMVIMVNFMFCVFYYNKKVKSNRTIDCRCRSCSSINCLHNNSLQKNKNKGIGKRHIMLILIKRKLEWLY